MTDLDLEQFAALAPPLQAGIRVSMENTGDWWLSTEPMGVPLFSRSFEEAGLRCVEVTRRYRRHQIRRAARVRKARVRKARRGWR